MKRHIIATMVGLSLLSATIRQAWKDGAKLTLPRVGTPPRRSRLTAN